MIIWKGKKAKYQLLSYSRKRKGDLGFLRESKQTMAISSARPAIAGSLTQAKSCSPIARTRAIWKEASYGIYVCCTLVEGFRDIFLNFLFCLFSCTYSLHPLLSSYPFIFDFSITLYFFKLFVDWLVNSMVLTLYVLFLIFLQVLKILAAGDWENRSSKSGALIQLHACKKSIRRSFSFQGEFFQPHLHLPKILVITMNISISKVEWFKDGSWFPPRWTVEEDYSVWQCVGAWFVRLWSLWWPPRWMSYRLFNGDVKDPIWVGLALPISY